MDLSCGTRYELYGVARNSVGWSEESKSLVTSTRGAKPRPPRLDDHRNLLAVDGTSLTLDLRGWEDEGCPIVAFSAEYKLRDGQSSWILGGLGWEGEGGERRGVSRVDGLGVVLPKKPVGPPFVVENLASGKEYLVRLTAFTEAGDTEETVSVLTSPRGGVIRGRGSQTSNGDGGFGGGDWGNVRVLAPIIASVFATVVSLASILFCWKHGNERHSIKTRAELFRIRMLNYTGGGCKRRSEGSPPSQGASVKKYSTASRDHQFEYEDEISPYATFPIVPCPAHSYRKNLAVASSQGPGVIGNEYKLTLHSVRASMKDPDSSDSDDSRYIYEAPVQGKETGVDETRRRTPDETAEEQQQRRRTTVIEARGVQQSQGIMGACARALRIARPVSHEECGPSPLEHERRKWTSPGVPGLALGMDSRHSEVTPPIDPVFAVKGTTQRYC
ncbi:unnamed protein product [Darwinula stevensoni]|uniref:Uncharacterized protein n=1 Tax=Darwinula stevensoni TaxID=69355 RepID=A0A7R9FPM1_9CRUS|nr:unnamed protein product [Darwinula stevensoni]CAG0897786.1 unnamed protein product [Darwinula stevensoni]